MNKVEKIYIAGHTGLLGAVILNTLRNAGYNNIITMPHKELDLTKQLDVEDFFKRTRPQYVILCAAKVGGIQANISYPAEFIYENTAIQTNIIHSAYIYGVKKLLYFASACTYPRNCPQPMKEEYLLSGYLESTNEPYAVAKISGLKMCQAYNKQYGTNFICAIPTNIYGPGDNFNEDDSHVISALIKKFYEAKLNRNPTVVIWGSGNPIRDFIYVDDLADASLFLMDNYNSSGCINISSGKGISIREIGYMIKEIVGYNGEIVFDSDKPDGMAKKVLDASKLKELGWELKTSIREGLKKTYEWYMRQSEVPC